MSDEFHIIEPLKRVIDFAGEEIQLSPLTVGQIPRAARALKAIGGEHLTDLASDDPDVLLGLLAERGDDLIELVAAVSGIDAARIRTVCPDELIPLAAAAFEVNADFFIQRLMPAIRGLTERINGAGPTPSSV